MVSRRLFSVGFIFAASFGFASISQAARSNVDLERLAKSVSAAQACLPTTEKNGLEFCTGFKLTSAQVDELVKGGRPECVRQIEKRGYTVVTDNAAKKVSESDWAAFSSGSVAAYTFHETKVVAFKRGDSLIDCARELIHVMQWTSGGKHELAPPNRAVIAQTLQDQLNSDISQIEKYEKANNAAQAQKLGQLAQKKIDVLKGLEALQNSLDEIEADYFIQQNCERLKCSSDDREATLANLFNKRDHLPASVRQQIQAEVQALLQKKKAEPIKKATAQWKKPDAKELSAEVDGLLGKSFDDLASALRKAGLTLIKVNAEQAGKTRLFQNQIPVEFFSKLPDASESERKFLASSKIVSGQAMGKFICKLDGLERPVIVVTPLATKGTLVHEYLHYRQSQRNADYCQAVFGQAKVSEDFATGKITRAEHDQRLLYDQAVNAVAEQEVYASMQEAMNHFDQLENLNNQAMHRQYSDWLRVDEPAN